MNGSLETPERRADRPPDAAAVASSVREARRRLVASQGIVRAILGAVFFIAFAAVRATTDYLTEAHMQAVMLLVVAFIALVILLPPVVSRLRRSRGVTLVGEAEGQTVRFFSRSGVAAVLALAGVGVAVLVALVIVDLDRRGVAAERIDRLDTMVALVCTAALVVLYVVRSIRVGMWEDVLMAAGVSIAGVLFALLRDRVRVEIIAMIAAHAAFASGLALHFRWRDYVRATPKEVAP